MKKQKFFLVGSIIILIVALGYSLNTDETLVGDTIKEQFGDIDWSEVQEKDIVKSSIPIILLEQNVDGCLMYAHYFGSISAHNYFVKGDELAKKFKFDPETRQITVPCDELHGEQSRLNVWYVVAESRDHATKYEYFITEWNSDEVVIPEE